MREIAYAISAGLCAAALAWAVLSGFGGARRVASERHAGAIAGAFLLAAALSFSVGETGSVWIIRAGLAAILATLSVIDIRTRTLPNAIVYPGAAAVILAHLASGPALGPFLGGLAGLACGLAMFAIGLLPRVLGHGQPGIGFGDVKLATLLGLVLGWPTIALGLWAGIVLAAIPAAGALIRRNPQAAFAFGPCLCAGAFVAWSVELAVR